jgi:hypothetical protein
MPRFDGTGPMGQGPMTGRGNGYCVLPLTDHDTPKSNSVPIPRVYPYGGFRRRRFNSLRGFGRGCGRGFARGRWW